MVDPVEVVLEEVVPEAAEVDHLLVEAAAALVVADQVLVVVVAALVEEAVVALVEVDQAAEAGKGIVL